MARDHIFYRHFPVLVPIEQWSFNLHHTRLNVKTRATCPAYENTTGNVQITSPEKRAR